MKSLDRSVPGNERYLFHSHELMLGDVVVNLIRKRFPELKDRVPVGATSAELPPNMMRTNIEKAERIFGTEWKSMEISVMDMVYDIIKAEQGGRVDVKAE